MVVYENVNQIYYYFLSLLQAVHVIADNYNSLNKYIIALLLATFCDLKASHNSYNGI